MSIEQTLERIAVATEKLVALLTPPEAVDQPKQAPPPDAEPKKRGRPAKAAAPEFVDEPEPVVVVPEETAEPDAVSESDDFLEEAAADLTIDDVRAALVAYANRPGVGQEKAKAMLAKESGCNTLTQLKAKNDQALFRAVVSAAQA